ncbi:amino acid ABC transporter permease [Rugosimonospora africana]|uniref:Glutamate ABC transporter permease n=1 Tax=Rugosimonospora africana TaxID=556532 RepID=A0A8J3R2U0_9ACTN|nr:amino acid ABC transporter permease [Rugosimonospora africana]GIH20842.1 glutamate ABC transporter permease [Rugosimonospora africana]
MTTVDEERPAPPELAPARRVRPTPATALYDAFGPRGRRRVLVATVVSVAVLAGFAVFVLYRLDRYGHLQRARWSYVLSPEILRYLGEGMLNNLKASVIAGALALVLGLVLALGRLSGTRAIRVPAVAWIEFFRGFPLVLLILFPYLLFPVYLRAVDPLWYVVIGLTLYNSAVIAEVYRAGILSLDRGQQEAAYAVGLRHGQAMRLVILPQAIRRMVPLLLTQLIILFKDSTLGVAVTYPDALRRGETMGSFEPRVVFQAIIVTAVMFFLVGLVASRLVGVLERHWSRG